MNKFILVVNSSFLNFIGKLFKRFSGTWWINNKTKSNSVTGILEENQPFCPLLRVGIAKDP